MVSSDLTLSNPERSIFGSLRFEVLCLVEEVI